MARTGGFAQLASTTHQMRLPFDNDIELTASTVCIITPPPLVRNIGEGRSGPQTVSAKTLYLRIRPSRYSITDLYIYTSCSAVAVIVVELPPGESTIAMRDHLLYLFSNICLYLGDTGRSLKARKAEHIRNVKKHNTGSNISRNMHGTMIM